MIQYLKHHQIDFNRWDESLSNSKNKLPYALSWYLDVVSPGWEALILGDYEYMMPLTVKRKYGIPYITKPLFSQQLGVFSKNETDKNIIKRFIDSIPLKYQYININFNTDNELTNIYIQKLLNNYELKLKNEYTTHFNTFSQNTKRNYKKACQYFLHLNANASIDYFIQEYQRNNPKFNPKIFAKLQRLLEKAIYNNSLEIVVIQNQENKCIAGTAFIKTLNRIIYLVSFSNEEGKEKSAMFLIINHIIKKYAATEYILDFEGSMIPGIARFFEGFGAEKKQYYFYKKLFTLF